MKALILVLICLSASPILGRQRKGSSSGDKETTSNRDGKLFSLFTIVNFKNDACISSSSISSGSTTYRNGTCYTSSECSSKGGSAKGNCASGFGVCCVFMFSSTSQTTVNYNDTYLQNPNYPSVYGDTTKLSYTINKCSSDVCFLRLDFETFQIMGPVDTLEADANGGGACVDSFAVTVNSGQTVPNLCGLLTGEHIYLDLGSASSDTATLELSFSGASTTRKWEIKVAQIPCGATYAPPSGCLQWHTALTGQIQTFNFGDTSSSHLAAQDYSACVRPAAGICCVEYSVCSTSIDNFSLANLAITNADGTGAKSAVGTECYTAPTAPATVATADYISIDSSGSTCGSTSTSRYCGEYLNDQTGQVASVPICDCTGPFSVDIKTDMVASAKSTVAANRGVCLNYRQLPCGST